MDVEDPVRAGHDLDTSELLIPLLENPRRQTGGVRESPSGDAVLDPHAVSLRHECMLADRTGEGLAQDLARALVRVDLPLDPLERIVDRLRVTAELLGHLLVGRALEV